ncbi:hypothetical protein [Rhodococcus jostii]|uniref:hypothetical protein n=1 Tax=Rhodococcus jostii TaxID=132919 RepID=UPI003642811F
MADAREWFSAETRRRVTAAEMARHLGVSRNTANSRMQDGLSADDIITLARALKVGPINALVELGKVTYDEVFSFLEEGGRLVETATEGELAIELAERLNPNLVRREESRASVHQFQKPKIPIPPTMEELEGLPFVAKAPDPEDAFEDQRTDHDNIP